MTGNRATVAEVIERMARREQRHEDEAARIRRVMDQGFVPADCGPDIPVAPARGVFRLVEVQALYPKGDDEFELKPAGYLGRKTMQLADAFDVMAAQSRRRSAPPFSPAQVTMGRFYRDLVERHAVAGVRCSSLEATGGGSGGGGGEFIDAVLRDRQRIEVMRRRIGTGSAMVVRRVRPSARGSRVSILDRMLVDGVCLKDQNISAVLRSHGWIVKGPTVKALTAALADCLDRMMGPVRGGSLSVRHFGDGPGSIWE